MTVSEFHRLSDFSCLGPVFIYGTGAAGRWMKAALENSDGTTVEGFLDTFQSGICEGLPVLQPQALRQRPADSFTVVIASMYVQEITQVLAENGIRNAINAYPYFTMVKVRAELQAVFDVEQTCRQMVEFLLRKRPGRRIAVFGHRQSASRRRNWLSPCSRAKPRPCWSPITTTSTSRPVCSTGAGIGSTTTMPPDGPSTARFSSCRGRCAETPYAI